MGTKQAPLRAPRPLTCACLACALLSPSGAHSTGERPISGAAAAPRVHALGSGRFATREARPRGREEPGKPRTQVAPWTLWPQPRSHNTRRTLVLALRRASVHVSLGSARCPQTPTHADVTRRLRVAWGSHGSGSTCPWIVGRMTLKFLFLREKAAFGAGREGPTQEGPPEKASDAAG